MVKKFGNYYFVQYNHSHQQFELTNGRTSSNNLGSGIIWSLYSFKYKTKLNFLGKALNDAESSLDCQDNGSEEASSRTARQRLTSTGQFTILQHKSKKMFVCLCLSKAFVNHWTDMVLLYSESSNKISEEASGYLKKQKINVS